jgi:hypothetical protein
MSQWSSLGYLVKRPNLHQRTLLQKSFCGTSQGPQEPALHHNSIEINDDYSTVLLTTFAPCLHASIVHVEKKAQPLTSIFEIPI